MTKQNYEKVPLSIVVDAVETASDEWNQYLDIEEMEIVSLPVYPFAGKYDEDEEELSELIEEGWNVRFFRLPSPYDIHEYHIMEQFIWELPEGRIQDSLEYAIRGRGAFRRFKERIIQYDIEEQWYDYQQEAYRKIAKEWCEDNDLEYEDDRDRI